MEQQTAVEWLLSELQIRLLKIKSEPDGIVRETMIYNFLIDTEQANQMQKEKHDAWNAFLEREKTLNISDVKTIERIQWYYNQYYNENFGNK